MPRGVILDVDGTLLLSNDAHARAWADAFRDFGYEIDVEALRPLIGMGGDKLMARVTPGLSEEDGVGKQIAERRKEIFSHLYAQGLKPAPGARALVQRMKDDGLRIAIASSAKGEELDLLLDKAGIADLIKTKTTSNEVSESKPAPDIVQVALDKLELPHSDVLMLGDTPYDIESAGKAGIRTIAVRCGGHSEDELKGAIAIFDNPEALLENVDHSPLNESAET